MKHTPATPLPWKTRRPAFPFIVAAERSNVCECDAAPDSATKNDDAAYIAHAANAYPKLVTALQQALCDLTPHEGYQSAHAARDLLRELGELS